MAGSEPESGRNGAGSETGVAEESEATTTFGRVTGAHQVRRGVETLKKHCTDSSAEHVWTRLTARGLIETGLLFGAVLLLCLFPFLILANGLELHRCGSLQHCVGPARRDPNETPALTGRRPSSSR
jgi:hypothetical protein